MQLYYSDFDVNLNWAYAKVSWPCISIVDFWIKYIYLDQITWYIKVRYAIDLNMEVMWILPKN